MSTVPEVGGINGVGDAAVRTRTGKTWSEWLERLDAAGARDLDHKAIVAHLAEHHPAIGGWWIQMVTVVYEQARGKRDKHEKPDGYQVSGSKTLAVPLVTLYAAWTDEDVRRRWLSDADLAIRKATPERSLRIAWQGGVSRVNVLFYPKGSDKSQVTVTHERLSAAAEAERMKAYWKERLDELKVVLETAASS